MCLFHSYQEQCAHSWMLAVTYCILYSQFRTRSKINSPKHKKDGLPYSTPQNSKDRRGKANTQPQSQNLGVEWDQGWVMVFPLISLLF